MGLALQIYGFRKLYDEEIEEFTGKEYDEIAGSDYYLKYYTNAPIHTRYWVLEDFELAKRGYQNIRHILSPVHGSSDELYFVCCREDLAYLWQKNERNQPIISRILGKAVSYSSDDYYHIVPYSAVYDDLERHPSAGGDDGREIIEYMYG